MWYRVTFYLILIYHTFSYSYHPKNSTTEKIWPDDTSNLLAVDFEIEGVVQGVNFREFTREKAKLLDLRGFVTNTKNGTVLGHLEGNADDVKHMKKWLRYVGSPDSVVEKAIFHNEKKIKKYTRNRAFLILKNVSRTF
ncbi:acylphosphatase-1-like isoform X2 [Lycorma delicatula]|uniref:acylphosphatase-1-like isoform X2 n=1 Tax=Lycorma delicatula TaxID=130591 RepID=UPI003F51404A